MEMGSLKIKAIKVKRGHDGPYFYLLVSLEEMRTQTRTEETAIYTPRRKATEEMADTVLSDFRPPEL